MILEDNLMEKIRRAAFQAKNKIFLVYAEKTGIPKYRTQLRTKLVP
jgi:hypothetical protein